MRKTSGISLLLLIFLSLCLIIFSLLSLSESTADLNLNRKSADRTTEYYAAVTRANEILAQIDEQLLTFLRESADTEYPEETYLERCRELVSSDPEIQFSISEPGKSDTPDADRTADSSDTLDSDRSADSLDAPNADHSAGSSDTLDSDRSTDSLDAPNVDRSADSSDVPYITLFFSVPVTDTQQLQAALALRYPEKADDVSYEITSWKIVNIRDWTPDTSQKVLRMTEP